MRVCDPVNKQGVVGTERDPPGRAQPEHSATGCRKQPSWGQGHAMCQLCLLQAKVQPSQRMFPGPWALPTWLLSFSSRGRPWPEDSEDRVLLEAQEPVS